MCKILCDKNLKKLLEQFLASVNVTADIQDNFDISYADISVMGNRNKFPECKFAVVSSENKGNLFKTKDKNCKIITCGLSTKDTVTLSSISENGGVFCLQRSLFTLGGKKIPPLEIPFEIDGLMLDTVTASILLSVALLCDVPLKLLNKIKL